MPDPKVYLTALVAAIATSVIGCWFARLAATRLGVRTGIIAEWLAVLSAFVAGAFVFGLPLRWPPTSGLGRLLVLILPAFALLEFAATLFAVRRASHDATATKLPRWWLWRHLPLVLVAPWILWWKSVYWPTMAWTNGAATVANLSAFLVAATSLGVVIASGCRLAEVVGRRLVLVTTSLSLCAAGMLISMAGYLQGGAATFPLAGSLAGPLIWLAASRGAAANSQGVVAWSGVCLWGTLFVGRFFGKITTVDAVAVVLAPSLGWLGVYVLRRSGSSRAATATTLLATILLVAIFLAWGGVLFRTKLGKLM